MSHAHHHHPDASHPDTREQATLVSCPCGEACLSCEAAELGVNCGCAFESKQFEYDVSHHAHMHDHHAVQHGMAETHDHEAMMAVPRMARHMEADMRRRFWWSLILTVPDVLYLDSDLCVVPGGPTVTFR